MWVTRVFVLQMFRVLFSGFSLQNVSSAGSYKNISNFQLQLKGQAIKLWRQIERIKDTQWGFGP